MKPIPAFPLQWPAGWKRTALGQAVAGRFGKRQSGSGGYKILKDVSVADAVVRVRGELERMRVSDNDIVVSTNLALRLDGFPRSDQSEPGDSGAAVYWIDRDGDTRCMAIDRYHRVADNLAAIAATLEAMRAIERHGGAEILSRAFTGFVALEHNPGAPHWSEVLGVDPATATTSSVKRAWQTLRSAAHPDRGGNGADFDAINKAYATALQEVSP